MKYEEFKIEVIKAVKQVYGEQVKVSVEKVWKNNGCSYEGLKIIKEKSERISPMVNMNTVYDQYRNEGMTLQQCVKHICAIRDYEGKPECMSEFVNKLMKWDEIKEEVYPMLIETKRNEVLLESLVSTKFLDLSVTYAIRGNTGEQEMFSVKISKLMLKEYGITVEQLHQQAIKNMKKDNYQFLSMQDYLKEVIGSLGVADDALKDKEYTPMMLLTNASKVNGSAGILDTELVSTLGKVNYFVILSCIHEVVFVLDNGEVAKEQVREMIEDVYANVIEAEEQLSNRVYYYTGATGEINIV